MAFLTCAEVHELRQDLQGSGADITCYEINGKKEAVCIPLLSPLVEQSSIMSMLASYSPCDLYLRGFQSSSLCSQEPHRPCHGNCRTSNLRVVCLSCRACLRVQGGATWDDVNESSADHGLAVVGATASHAGVAESTLGGGFGWLTGRHGRIVDNLLSVEIALADGSIVQASEESHEDLFWAVRGAAEAFGIITEFVFRAYDLSSSVYGGLLIFSADQLPGLLEFAVHFDREQDIDSGFCFGFCAPSSPDRTAILALPFYNGSREKANEFFAPLLSLGPLGGHTGMMSYSELNQVANIGPIHVSREHYYRTKVSAQFDLRLVNDLWEQFDGLVQTHHDARHSLLLFELIPYLNAAKVPHQATACASPRPCYGVGLFLCWNEPGLDATMHSYLQTAWSKIEEKQNAYFSHSVSNAEGELLFGENLHGLQELKRRYDPDNIFSKWCTFFHLSTGSQGSTFSKP